MGRPYCTSILLSILIEFVEWNSAYLWVHRMKLGILASHWNETQSTCKYKNLNSAYMWVLGMKLSVLVSTSNEIWQIFSTWFVSAWNETQNIVRTQNEIWLTCQYMNETQHTCKYMGLNSAYLPVLAMKLIIVVSRLNETWRTYQYKNETQQTCKYTNWYSAYLEWNSA